MLDNYAAAKQANAVEPGRRLGAFLASYLARRFRRTVFDILARADHVGFHHLRIGPGLAELFEHLLNRGERWQQHDQRVDAADIAHLLQLLSREDRAAVAVTTAHHVDER